MEEAAVKFHAFLTSESDRYEFQLYPVTALTPDKQPPILIT
jgi:hypothetical protein